MFIEAELFETKSWENTELQKRAINPRDGYTEAVKKIASL